MAYSRLLQDFRQWMLSREHTNNVINSYASYLNALFKDLYRYKYFPLLDTWQVLDELYDNLDKYGRTEFVIMLRLIEYAIEKAYKDDFCRIDRKYLNDRRSAFRKFEIFILEHVV